MDKENLIYKFAYSIGTIFADDKTKNKGFYAVKRNSCKCVTRLIILWIFQERWHKQPTNTPKLTTFHVDYVSGNGKADSTNENDSIRIMNMFMYLFVYEMCNTL